MIVAILISAQDKEPTKGPVKAGRLSFRWSYIILPVAILLLSIIVTIFFYRHLPAEVAYRFKFDGSPDKSMSRSAIITWMLLLQLFLTMLAVAITWGVTKLSILFGQTESTWIRPERMLLFMGNIIALPQLIIGFAMLDIFSYNAYQTHIMPMWIFLLIILGLATIGLGLFLRYIFSRASQQSISQPKD